MMKFLVSCLVMACIAASVLKAQTPQLPARVFQQSRFSMDKILARPYDSGVPFGASGERVWATSPQGWAFAEGVQLVYLTNLNAFGLTVKSGETNYVVGKAEYFPSHVEMTGEAGAELTASASFTYVTDNVLNPLSKPFEPGKRWTCWSSGRREDWYTIDWGKPRTVNALDVYFFDDAAIGGECRAPESLTIEAHIGGKWQEVNLAPFVPIAGKNSLRFPDGIRTERLRLNFRHKGAKFYTGLYGVEPFWSKSDAVPTETDLRVTGAKWITPDDVLTAQITIENTGKDIKPLFVRMDSPLSGMAHGFLDSKTVAGYPLHLAAGGTDGKMRDDAFVTDIRPNEKRTFRFACAVAENADLAQFRLKTVLADRQALATQIAAYQGWFDENIGYFACSDPLVSKLYYHRWYNLKKNSLNPQMGALRHRTFAEGRWTSLWYANVISYGAAHQLREARWLRDPSYAWGHLLTWTNNPRPDGIFPSHITPEGQRGGQYCEWIGAAAWDTYLVHPDRESLGKAAQSIQRDVEGWRKIYGWNNSPLLVADSHWWTGMEWQPSFFAFANYQTGGGSGEAKDKMTPLRRVDLTAFQFGNAQASANIWQELGKPDAAEKMRNLAEETRRAVLAEMWNEETHWFHSLRHTDNVKAPTKEIIGVYPFYFGLPPAGKGYESAWATLLDPALFWTTYPLASVSKDCPAYSQNGWPVGAGGSICMWNGPSWPHANSLVLTAMANSLRTGAKSALTRAKLYALFHSFTRAQFKNGDVLSPWTGEYYNGDTGEWKTEQRDYHHSTWIDPLIEDLIGIVPRNDDILEIDSLLPPEAWTYYVLDGQAYRGHTVTVAYDRDGGKIAPRFRGYAVYLDGKLIHQGERPARVLYDMNKRATVSSAGSGQTVTLTVKIEGVTTSQGVVRVALFDKATGFPNGKNAAVAQQTVAANGETLTVTFANLKAGTYALAVQHDKNNDGKLNRNTLGIPTERYGFSNGARGTFGPPSFGAASFALDADRTVTVRVK